MVVPLNFLKVAGTKTTYPPLIVLHGLMGNLRNFSTFANKVFKAERDVFLVDLRNHGSSPWAEEMNYHAMARDVGALVKELKLSEYDLLGFSMGGKVAMTMCLEGAEHVRKLIVGDTAPVNHESSRSTVPSIVSALYRVDLGKYKDRRDVDTLLKSEIRNDKERGFVLTNLIQNDSGLKWKANLPIIHDALPTIMGFPSTNSSSKTETLFLKGGNSLLVDSIFYPRIKELFPHHQISEYPGKGHWIHEEDPQQFTYDVTNFINK